jgi:hypothetical protein
MTRLTTKRYQRDESILTVNPKEMWATSPFAKRISFKDYKRITNTYNELLLKNVIDTGDVFRLPSGAGLLGVLKRPTRKDSLNFNHFRQTGEKIYYNNLHSDGYAATIKWRVKEVSEIENNMHLLLKFKPSKKAKKYLHERIVEDNAINKYYDSF